ncbi:MAG TPA: hypothetical protein VE338_05730 [Ktedonobacterales bacterium]|jgi:hypothetical protein|nr:hypothetical protein [Ktedonobacterales bacterium]
MDARCGGDQAQKRPTSALYLHLTGREEHLPRVRVVGDACPNSCASRITKRVIRAAVEPHRPARIGAARRRSTPPALCPANRLP